MSDNTNGWRYFGRIPCLHTPLDDYRDFEALTLDGLQVAAGLRMGVYPPGLQLAYRGWVLQVVGRYGYQQRLQIDGRIG